MTNIEALFYEALETKNLRQLEQIPKSDLHNHAGRGGNIQRLSPNIKPPHQAFDSLNDMQTWFEENVKVHCKQGLEGYLYRVQAAFIQAQADQILKLSLSFGLGEVEAVGGIEKFEALMDGFKNQYIPDADFIPELSLLRGSLSEGEISSIKEVMSYGWFKSLDVCGDELKVPINSYKPLYQYAKSKGMLLKLHVGEFGSAEDVRHAVDLLELDEVHHGIAAAHSKSVMKYLRDQQIILNICPMSNIMLKRVKDYFSHPIKTLYENGVPVTINTDDLAIFNATVSQEYLNLYQYKLLSKEALNAIRIGGLTAYSKY